MSRSVPHKPVNTPLRIDAVYAYVSVDEDGNEGVCAATMPGGALMPLIAADKARLQSLAGYAQAIATSSGMRLRLIRLSVRTDLDVIEPQPPR